MKNPNCTIPAGVTALLGVLFLLCGQSPRVGLELLAVRLSSDGQLSADYLAGLNRMETGLGWAFLLAALLTPLFYRRLERLAALLTKPASWPAFLLACGVGSFVSAFLTQSLLFDNIPHVTDAVVHLFQAQLFVQGHMTAPLPACPHAFLHPHIVMTTTGVWFSKYTPGHALLLALAMKMGALNLLLPACSALGCFSLMQLARRLAGPATAITTGLLYVASPLLTLLGGSYMSHTTFLAIYLAGLALWPLAPVRHERLRLAGAGFLLAFSALIRPHDFVFLCAGVTTGALIAIPWPVWKRSLCKLPWLLLGALPPFLYQGYWNQVLYGHVLTIGYGFTTTNFLFPTFQADYGFTDTFTPCVALGQTLITAGRFNLALLGWPISVLFVPWAVLDASWRRKALALLACPAILILAYFPYSYTGLEYEARYYSPMAPALLLLTAIGMRWFWRCSARPLLLCLVAASTFFALGYYWPERICKVYNRHYEGIARELHEAAMGKIEGRALVLLGPLEKTGYHISSGFLHNDPALTNRIIYAQDLPDQIPCLQAAFPDRRLYRYQPGRPDVFESLPE
jgi:hypothetical protein